MLYTHQILDCAYIRYLPRLASLTKVSVYARSLAGPRSPSMMPPPTQLMICTQCLPCKLLLLLLEKKTTTKKKKKRKKYATDSRKQASSVDLLVIANILLDIIHPCAALDRVAASPRVDSSRASRPSLPSCASCSSSASCPDFHCRLRYERLEHAQWT